jgi:pyruvate dehydrogenase E1 component alpha subunit/2-oxoisovalerate dehydrogenase E1 component alpha subunit
MILTRAFDDKMSSLFKQGRMSFLITCRGQEACGVGSAYALQPQDWLFPAYREVGAAIARGADIKRIVAQYLGTSLDYSKGRSMANHFGDRKLNFVHNSSCVGSQIPHAVGVALGAKLKHDEVVSLAYFGDGATSHPDFHASMNFAAVYDAPVILFCQNNQYAISTPVTKQMRTQTIAEKGKAYGIDGVRVDGNDILAVYKVTREAAEKARRGDGPTLIEAVTYRIAPHSGADDATRYRDDAEVQAWLRKDPITRFSTYLTSKHILKSEAIEKIVEESEEKVTRALRENEAAPPLPIETIFEDVYADMPPHLQDQLQYAKESDEE